MAIEVFTFVLVVVALLGLTTAVFGGWVLVTIGRAIGRAMGIAPAHTPALPSRMMQRCPAPGCRRDNPVEARFCRRCGKPLSAPGVKAARVWVAT